MEGSVYTGKGTSTDSCNVGVPAGNEPSNIDRRYVIDERMGSVSMLCVFQTMANAPDSHEFRLEGGKIRYVHTTTMFKSSTMIGEGVCVTREPRVFVIQGPRGQGSAGGKHRTEGVLMGSTEPREYR